MNAPNQITTLLIEQLIPSPTNPRKHFDEAKLQELANSIKAHGVLQPILVREQPYVEGKPCRAEIISGERGYRAAKLAGIDMVPVMIRNLTDTEVLHAQVIENLQRDDLHELEEAEGYERLLKEEDLTGATPQLRPEVFRLLAIEILDQSKSFAAKAKLVTAHLGEEVTKQGTWEANRAFKEHLQTLHPQTCMLIMIDLIMAPEEKAEDWQVKQKDKPDTLLALAAMHTIDADALKKQAEQEIKEEVDAKKKVAAAKPVKKTEKEEPAATVAKQTTKAKPKKAEPESKSMFAATPGSKLTGWPFPTPGKMDGEAA